MVDVNNLKKIGDVLNGEGMFLGLFRNNSGNLYLGSHLKDGSGDLYYSVNLDVFKKYLNAEINLRRVYIESDDFKVTRKFRNEHTLFIKDDRIDYFGESILFRIFKFDEE